ncbi:hypothetical protein HI914_01601 [Erysiphe necator]|nr:hypothetical protein HI914_01601 [Erysiphe necator]
MEGTTKIVDHQKSYQEQTLKTIKARIVAQENLLHELRSTSDPIDTEASSDPTTYYRQLRCLTETFKSLDATRLCLSTSDFLLPDLLAKGVTAQIISETKLAISQLELLVQNVKNCIEREKVNLQDTKLIQAELVSRIASLRDEAELYQHKSPETLAQEKIRELEKQKRNYESETSHLIEALYSFVDENLASMLVVEELGGPVVGQMMTVDEKIFESGFTNHGKVKKTKFSEDKRQGRINHIWGSSSQEKENWDEKSAAASEIKELIEKLLNNVINLDEHHPNNYIKLRRESAVARLMIRSKVAQYHPKDASKLRLIEFGTEISD